MKKSFGVYLCAVLVSLVGLKVVFAQTENPPFRFVSAFEQNLKMTNPKMTLSSGTPSHCQPDLFDPLVTKYHPVDGGYYESAPPSEKGTTFLINGYEKNGDAKIQPVPGLLINFYRFVCASEEDFVLEVTADKKRRLFTHVDQFAVAEGRYLYLTNSLKKNDNSWETFVGIIDLETNQETAFPQSELCVSSGPLAQGFWSSETLITYDSSQMTGGKGKTYLCSWDKEGKLLQRFESDRNWIVVGNGTYFPGSFGFLPKAPGTLFSVLPSQDLKTPGCFLWLQDSQNPAKLRSVQLTRDFKSQQRGLASECVDLLEVDTENLDFSSSKVKFRQRQNTYEAPWEEWKEVVFP